MSNCLPHDKFSSMDDFQMIVASSYDNAELSCLRRFIVDWHSEAWQDCHHSRAFAVIWRTGQFDALEARCEELVNGTP